MGDIVGWDKPKMIKILWYYGIYQTKKSPAKRVDNKKTFEGRTLSEDEDEPRILTVLPIWI